jgi:hypothetical protein
MAYANYAAQPTHLKTSGFPERYDRNGDVATYTALRGRRSVSMLRDCPTNQAVAAATGKLAPDALLFSWPEASERRRLRCPLDAY